MSGNMNFLNDNRGTTGSVMSSESSQQQNGRNPRNLGTGSFLSRGGTNRSSSSFLDGISVLNSFMEDGEPNLNFEGLCDKDVWGNRIILSALEDAVFSEVPHPKLSPEVIQGLQKFLLCMNAVSSNCNPFVEYEKPVNTSLAAELAEDDVPSAFNKNSNRKSSGFLSKLEAPRELVESLTRESKIVLRSLVKAYIRKQTVKIRDFWKTILEMNGVTVPDISATLPAGPRSVVGGPSSEGDLKGLCDAILDQATTLQKRSHDVDVDLQDLLKKGDEEMFKSERDIKKEKTLETLKEQAAQEEHEYVKKYLEYFNLENECVEQQHRLEKLKTLEEEKGTEEEQKTREDLYNLLKVEHEKMVNETEEMEERFQKYKSLGTDYLKIVEEYKGVEEEIRVKEWVLDQLKNGPKELSDSFYD